MDGKPSSPSSSAAPSPCALGRTVVSASSLPRGGEGALPFLPASPLAGLLEAFLRPLQESGEPLLHGQAWPLLLEPLPQARESPGGAGPSPTPSSPPTAWPEGRPRYLSPENPEFSTLLEANLNRKAKALGLPPGQLRVPPIRGNQPRTERFRGTWARAWTGRFALLGAPRLLPMALTAGLGAKNPQGLGFVQEVFPFSGVGRGLGGPSWPAPRLWGLRERRPHWPLGSGG